VNWVVRSSFCIWLKHVLPLDSLDLRNFPIRVCARTPQPILSCWNKSHPIAIRDTTNLTITRVIAISIFFSLHWTYYATTPSDITLNARISYHGVFLGHTKFREISVCQQADMDNNASEQNSECCILPIT